MSELAGLVAKAVGQHGSDQAALLPILHTIREELGFVPPDATALLADALNLSRAEIHGVISFYPDFRRVPPGRHIVRLCRAEACQAAGGNAVAERFQEASGIGFGGTTADGRVTLDEVYCLGLCAVAPAGMVDGRPVGRLDAEAVARLVGEADR